MNSGKNSGKKTIGTVSEFLSSINNAEFVKKFEGVVTDVGLRKKLAEIKESDDEYSIMASMILEGIKNNTFVDDPPKPPPKPSKNTKTQPAPATAVVQAVAAAQKPVRPKRPREIKKSEVLSFINELEDYADDMEEYAEIIEAKLRREKKRVAQYDAIMTKYENTISTQRKLNATLAKENEELKEKFPTVDFGDD